MSSVKELPDPDEGSTSASEPKTLPHLPNEVLINILGQLLKTPNGLHSDRWSMYKKVQVDRFLTGRTPVLAKLVPEALYKNNAVIINITGPYAVSDRSPKYVSIPYPKPSVNIWVQELEIRLHPPVYDPNETCFAHQANFLRRLASGELGFQNLRTFRLAIGNPEGRKNANDLYYHDFIKKFVREVKRSGVFKFRAKKVEIVIYDHHGCYKNKEGEYDCDSKESLEAIMFAHQDPLEETLQSEEPFPIAVSSEVTSEAAIPSEIPNPGVSSSSVPNASVIALPVTSTTTISSPTVDPSATSPAGAAQDIPEGQINIDLEKEKESDDARPTKRRRVLAEKDNQYEK